jgi:hypothetical protein
MIDARDGVPIEFFFATRAGKTAVSDEVGKTNREQRIEPVVPNLRHRVGVRFKVGRLSSISCLPAMIKTRD